MSTSPSQRFFSVAAAPVHAGDRSTVPVAGAFQASHDLAAIDALRGYAILLVILAHTIDEVTSLVWPVRRVMTMGFYGVQLFFIASAVTLLMSWSRSSGTFRARYTEFLTHRFFRIAPLYYLAIGFYWIVRQQSAADFSFEKLLAFLLFYNTWAPHLIPADRSWMPVPGGWSISVEFCFYFVFPLLAVVVSTMRRAAMFVLAALLIMVLASTFGWYLYPETPLRQRDTFLYFWFPNHLIVFAIGFVVFHALRSRRVSAAVLGSRLSANNATVVLLLLVLALSFYGARRFLDLSTYSFPTHVLISIAFAGWALVLLLKPRGVVINPAIVSIGKLSFSMYVVHFAMMDFATWALKHFWPSPPTGIGSVLYAAGIFCLAAVTTYVISRFTYVYIERPLIRFGKAIARPGPRVPSVTQAG